MAIKVKPLCCNRRAGAKLFSNLLCRQFNYFLLVINWPTFMVTHTEVQSLAHGNFHPVSRVVNLGTTTKLC